MKVRDAASAAERARVLSERLSAAIETADLLEVLRNEVGLTSTMIATACGVSDRTVRSWLSGSGIRLRHDDRLRDLATVVGLLATTLTPRGVCQWLTLRNPLLQGRRPMEALGEGDIDAVLQAAEALAGDSYA